MDGLSAFLAENVEKIPNKKLVVSNRFKDENGKPIEWEIQAIDGQTNEELQRKAMVTVKQPNGQMTREQDAVKYTGMMLAYSVVYPDLNNAKLQDSYKARKPEELLKKMLYPREENKLAQAVLELSQLDNLDDAIKDAKN